jgi:hypothetical protein
MSKQTRTVKILGVVVRRNVQYHTHPKHVRRGPGDVPTRQVSRGIIRRGRKGQGK